MGLSLGDVKKKLGELTVSFKMKRLSHMELGYDVWHIEALEDTGRDALRKRNYRVFSKGVDDNSPAWWDDAQKPASRVPPSQSSSVSTFSEELRDWIKEQISDGQMQYAEILAVDEQNKRARLKVVTAQYAEKQMLVVKTESGFETQEITV